jgi:hypothetical protein
MEFKFRAIVVSIVASGLTLAGCGGGGSSTLSPEATCQRIGA